MSTEVTIAPKERVNITFKASTGDSQAEIELPLKILMIGDYTGKQDSTPLEERQAISIDKDNFNEVLSKQNIELSFVVSNKLTSEEDAELPVSIKLGSLRDFEPANVAGQVPELKQLVDLRNALTALKGPLGNVPAFRRKLETLIKDEDLRAKLIQEITK